MEWQKAHWIPMDSSFPAVSKKPVTPTTELILKQRQGRCRIVNIYLAGFDLFHQAGRQRVRINFQSDGKRGFWAHARACSAQFFSGNRLLQMQSASPKSLVAKSVIAEGLPALVKHLLHVRVDHLIICRCLPECSLSQVL